MKHLISIIVLIIFSLPLASQNMEKAQIEKIIDSMFKPIDNPSSPGVAITVLQNEKVIAKKSYGLSNLEHSISFTHQSPVRLGYSGTREFMCVGLALMEADGLLSFDDKVKKYFPKLPVWSEKVTIQDLLNHSSGFDDEWATMLLMQADMNNRVDKEQLLTLLYNQPKPQVEPSKGYMYSNSDFALLRFIMEMASQKNLPDYLHQKLFAPLGMNATIMNDRLEQIIPGLAENYYGYEYYFKEVGVKTSPGGNYRMVTTASDLEKWAIAVEDSTSMVSKAIRLLYKDARPIPVLSPEAHYVFGHEWQKIEGLDIIKHGGVNHDFYMTRIPSMKITIIGLGNSSTNMTAAMSLADIILNKKEKKGNTVPTANPSSINTKEWANYTGRYFQQNKPGHSSHIPKITFYDIKMESDSLHFYYTSNDFFTMMPIGENLFKDPDYGAIIQIKRQHPDSTMKMQIWPPDGSLKNFSKSKVVVNNSKTYLEQFTGEYHSEHLDFYCRVVFNDNGQLVIRRPTIAEKPLIPDGENRFLFESDGFYVVAVFTKNQKGNVDGIKMQHVRMMHHRFEKVK